MEDALKELFLYLPSNVLERDHELSNGNGFPMISFGTCCTDGFETVFNAIDAALETGYRSFDVYPSKKNEEEVGCALEQLLPKHNLTREDVFITTKLSPEYYGREIARHAVLMSLQNLRTWYIDMCLLKWPGGLNMDPELLDNEALRLDSWCELSDLHREGILKNVGVSNFTARQLTSFMDNCCDVKPVMNQVEFHPRFPQKELLLAAKENNVLLQSICFEKTFHVRMITDEVVVKVAKRVDRTPTQVILKWILNNGVAVTTQSTDPKCIHDNFQLFDFLLEKTEMDELNNIGIREKYLPNTVCIV